MFYVLKIYFICDLILTYLTLSFVVSQSTRPQVDDENKKDKRVTKQHSSNFRAALVERNAVGGAEESAIGEQM